MGEGFARGKELLEVEDVAGYLGVGSVTVWRWCRDGTLPCLKIARTWRIRREALEDFLRRSELPATLAGQLRSFLEIPDNILAIAQSHELMHRLNAAFFRVGVARDGMLVRYHANDQTTTLDDLRADLERNGLETRRLEDEGRLRFVTEPAHGRRPDELRQLLGEETSVERSVWVNFDWAEQIDPEAALRQQEALMEFIEGGYRLVVKTSVLERVIDEWPGAMLRRAQALHSGTIWITKAGLALTRVRPLPRA